MNQFRKVIRNWEDWEATAGEISAFSGVVEKIFHNEGLPAADIRKLPPSTNAVFRVGDYVIKIYAPRQAQMEPEEEQRIERFAMWRAGEAGVPVPEIAAWGCLKDQYDFYYLISRYMVGQPFGEVVRRMETTEKRRIGARLRDLTDRMFPAFGGGDAGGRAGDSWQAADGKEEKEKEYEKIGFRRGGQL